MPKGEVGVPSPASDVSWEILVNPFVACAVVMMLPSGNLKPPIVEVTTPLTLSLDAGDVVPIPTLPPVSKIAEFASVVDPENFGTKFSVPPLVVTAFCCPCAIEHRIAKTPSEPIHLFIQRSFSVIIRVSNACNRNTGGPDSNGKRLGLPGKSVAVSTGRVPTQVFRPEKLFQIRKLFLDQLLISRRNRAGNVVPGIPGQECPVADDAMGADSDRSSASTRRASASTALQSRGVVFPALRAQTVGALRSVRPTIYNLCGLVANQECPCVPRKHNPSASCPCYPPFQQPCSNYAVASGRCQFRTFVFNATP